jgi:hypothetical protein
VSYKDLAGEMYTTEWRINPLLYEGLRYDTGQPSWGLSDPSSENEKVDKAGESSRSAGDGDGRRSE